MKSKLSLMRGKPLFIQTYLLIIFTLTAVVIGTLMVFYGRLFQDLTNIAQERAKSVWYFSGIALEQPYLGFIFTPLLFVIAAMLCRKLAPKAAGSGPEHVLMALRKLGTEEGKKEGVYEYLSLRVAIVKVISSLVSVFAGGALGREGPAIQISASIFYVIGEKVKQYLPNIDLRSWVIAGGAGGFAAAFNAPFAGIIFAIEELAEIHFRTYKMTVLWTVVLAGVTAQMITGSYMLFEFPVVAFKWSLDLSVILLVAILCGFLAWVLRRIIIVGNNVFSTMKGWTWYLVPVAGGMIVAAISFSVGNFTYGAGVLNMQYILASPEHVMTYDNVIGRYINVCANALSGVAGGLLLPSLALGGGIGSLLSELAPGTDARIFATTGMAAFLGALLHVPLTAAIVVLEMTNQRELIFPLVISSVVGSWVFQRLNDIFVDRKPFGR